jgi:dephospho-CoA kinase
MKSKLLIGVTGGIGSGKSLVCKYLKELGCEILNADDIAKKLYVTNPSIRRALTGKFGGEILTGKRISISKLREFTFKNSKNQRAVNKVVHPFVISEVLRRVSNSPYKFVAVEAALIFESGFDKYNDYVILVHANIRKRIERSSLNEKYIRKVMKLQMPEREKMRRADFIIENNGTKQALRRKVRNVFRMLIDQYDRHSCLPSWSVINEGPCLIS